MMHGVGPGQQPRDGCTIYMVCSDKLYTVYDLKILWYSFEHRHIHCTESFWFESCMHTTCHLASHLYFFPHLYVFLAH